MRSRTTAAAALAAALLLPAAARANATITIVNANAAGVGFNDPTPATPVGGNPGTTLGDQRLNAFRYAASIWGQTLDSAVEIKILATFEPLACTASSAVLGSAGARFVNMDFRGAPLASTWYSSALSNKIARQDLVEPGDPDLPPGDGGEDIRARFNSNLGNSGCLTGTSWYLGFDRNHGTNIDLVTVLLHEFAHGLGFQTYANSVQGALLLGYDDTYSRLIYDDVTGKGWGAATMTNAERAASAVNPRNVVTTGTQVTKDAPAVLQSGTPLLRVTAPAAIAGSYQVGTASFGPPLSSPGLSGTVAAALSGTSTLACGAITNPADVAGKIALVDRGTCTFVVKAANVQAAGAIAMIVADNAASAPPAGLGGADPSILIPAVRITQADGSRIRAQLASGVTATLGVDLSVRAGADAAGRALLYTPNPYESGSSVSHWDTIATPNQLMEPAINGDLTHSVEVPQDLTTSLLRDVGWYEDADVDNVPDARDACLGSDTRATVKVGAFDTGVPNLTQQDGCTFMDRIGQCAKGAKNHGAFVSCVAGWTNAWVAGTTDLWGAPFALTPAQKDAIQSAAARTK